MTFYQQQQQQEQFVTCQKENKQRINFILDNNDEVLFQNKLPELNTQQQKKLSFKYEPTNNTALIQRLPSPFDNSEEEHLIQQQQQQYYNKSMAPPTATEMQYIKRIHALMTLVSKQTKEIHSLREIISSYNQENDSLNLNRKRNKQ